MTHAPPLGRRPATDDRHLRRYGLTPATMPGTPTPVVLGINWYETFDIPDSGWIGWRDDWGAVRGGHAVCLKPPALIDTRDWWRFYDQGTEGACVGFAASRMMTLLNRQRYDATRLYHEARRVDEWPGEDYSGTSVRAGMDVLRLRGHWTVRAGVPSDVAYPEHGVSENRWATSVEEIAACLSPQDDGRRVLDAGCVVLLNSWGTSYPHHVRLSLDALDRLVFREDGEATVVTDRRPA